MARPKKAKQNRPDQESASATLDQLESRGDRLVEWVTANPLIVLGTAFAILVIGSGIGLVQSNIEDSKIEATGALATVQREYRTAMGAQPDDLLVADPANPETATRVRTEYVNRFLAAAEAHQGTAAGALAALDGGLLQLELGEDEAALETWRGAVQALDPDETVAALLGLRIAGVLESKASWVEAGEAFEKAGSVADFPLRYSALADAARCYAEAGEVERALELFARINDENPGLYMPEHLVSMLRELRVSRRLN